MGLHAKIWHNVAVPACDVFINHRTVDTRRTVVRLLYDHLRQQGCKPFLDTEYLKPGDRLLETIDKSIRGCKVGVTVFSPHYCDSYYCLHELSLLVESKKRIVPIFYDVKPSQLQVKKSVILSCSQKDLMKKFNLAIEEAKSTVGLSFDSYKEKFIDSQLQKIRSRQAHGNLRCWSDWSELVRKTSNAVMSHLHEEISGSA